MSINLKLFYVELESGECMLIKANNWLDVMAIESSTNLPRDSRRTIREATDDDITQILKLENNLPIYH